MAQVNAGRVRFVSRGEYNNSTQYYLFDLVDYNGSSYFAKANTTGNVPTNTTYWQLVAEKGNTGGDGPVGPTGNGIASIVKTASAGLIDTYTITFTDGTTSTFNITNGQDGEVTQEYVDEENERLKSVFNVLPKVSGSGESVTLNDTGDTMLYKIDLKGNTSQEVVQGEVGLEVEDTSIYVDDVNESKEDYITLKGNTYQYSTTGKNLFKETGGVSNGTYNNGLYTSNSLSSYQVMNMNGENITYIANTKYYISMDLRKTTGTGAINAINVGTTTGVVNHFPTISNEFQKYYIEFTPTSDYTSNKITVQSGNASVVFEVKNLMVSTSSDTNYEPYTGNQPSPSPDYPQDIQVVTGDNEVKVEGKNLFDKTSGIVNDRTYDTDGSIIYQGSNSISENYMSVIPSDYYTISGTFYAVVCEYDKNKNFIGKYGNLNQNVLTRQASANTYYIRIKFQTSKLDTVQVVIGNTAPTTYTPYVSQTYPINLGTMELCKIGTYQDRIYKNNGNWYVNKEIGKVVLDGTNNAFATKSGQQGNTYTFDTSNFIAGPASTDVPLFLSDKFIPKSWDERGNYLDNEIMFLYRTTHTLNFRFGTSSSLTTLELANAWLVNNNVTLYGILATPTDTQITDTTLVNQLNALYNATIYSTTHINTETSNLLPYIDLKYNVVTASPSPDRASEVEVVKGNNTITISNEDGTKTQSYNITLGNLELCKIGDYQDYIYYDKSADKWYIYKTIEEILLNGTENYDMSSNGNVFYLNNAITNITSIENMKCNYYLYDAFSNLYNANTDYGISFNTSNTKIAIRDKDISSVNDFKTWLSNNNTIIYYPLSTPTTTQITDQLLVSQLDELQKAMSYYDKTLITQTNADKPFILDVIGIRDLQDIFELISGE